MLKSLAEHYFSEKSRRSGVKRTIIQLNSDDADYWTSSPSSRK